MTTWALFDSGNGSYFKGANSLNSSGGANIEIYSIGFGNLSNTSKSVLSPNKRL